MSVGRTRDQDDHGLVAGHREVRPTRGLGVDGTDGQRLQLGLVELRPIAEVASALEHGPDPVTGMMVRRDLRIGPDIEQLRISPGLEASPRIVTHLDFGIAGIHPHRQSAGQRTVR